MKQLLKIPSFIVPAHGFPITDYPAHDWSGFLLKSDQLPIIGAYGMFSLVHGSIYPRGLFGKKQSLLRRPRVLVIRNDFGASLILSDSLLADLKAANVDVHGGQTDFDTGGWNFTGNSLLGTCVPANSESHVTVPLDGIDSIFIDIRNAGGSAGSGVPGFPDPAAVFPGFFNYISAVDGIEDRLYAAFSTFPTIGLNPGSHVITPAETQSKLIVTTDPTQYIGHELLVLQSFSESISSFGGCAYTTVQCNAHIADLDYFTPSSHTPYDGHDLKIDFWESNCYPHTALIAADQAFVNAAKPRFDKVAWHIFATTPHSTTFADGQETATYGTAKQDLRISTQLNAATTNLTNACNIDGVTLHNVGSPIGSIIDPAEAEGIIRDFFDL